MLGRSRRESEDRRGGHSSSPATTAINFASTLKPGAAPGERKLCAVKAAARAGESSSLSPPSAPASRLPPVRPPPPPAPGCRALRQCPWCCCPSVRLSARGPGWQHRTGGWQLAPSRPGYRSPGYRSPGRAGVSAPLC